MIDKSLPATRHAGNPMDTALSGSLYALSAFFVWGLSPIYFKLLQAVPATEIFAHRIVWSALLMGGVVLLLRSRHAVVEAFTGWRRLGTYVLTTLLISVNWLLFIWAINSGHIVQASLGYYINPLVNVLLGVLFLKERLNGRQMAAVVLAVLGVSSLIVSVGELPWISLTLAFTFGFYALIRKKAGVDPLIGLLAETLLITPIAIAWLLWLGAQGEGAFGGNGIGFDLLLVGSGAVTAIPLILFNYGAQRLRLSTIGLMQYLAPTLQLILGVALYGEIFTSAHAIAFGLIWAGLVIYSSDAFHSRRTVHQAAE
jgi:chloramphenicol-sensitive protein RarD